MSTLFSKPEQLSIVNDGGIGETIAICDFNTTLLWFRFSEVQLNTICDKIQKTSRLYIQIHKYTPGMLSEECSCLASGRR